MRLGYKELGLELVFLDEKIKMTRQEILSKCFSRNPSCNKGTK
jgi:hypothetical protein